MKHIDMDVNQSFIDVKEKIRLAREELSRLCNGKKFQMRVPVQEEDSDVVIGTALAEADRILGIFKDPSEGTGMIFLERQRQINQEGWTSEHDDEHVEGEMALAALAYIWSEWIPNSQILKMYWPWDPQWWKPKDRISNLVRAGALIAAEIDRLKRIENQKARKGE